MGGHFTYRDKNNGRKEVLSVKARLLVKSSRGVQPRQAAVHRKPFCSAAQHPILIVNVRTGCKASGTPDFLDLLHLRERAHHSAFSHLLLGACVLAWLHFEKNLCPLRGKSEAGYM